jgi:hypothetical protein
VAMVVDVVVLINGSCRALPQDDIRTLG